MHIEPYENKKGKLVSGRITVYLGKDAQGKEVRLKATFKVPAGYSRAKAMRYLNERGVEFERKSREEYAKRIGEDSTFMRDYTFREYSKMCMDTKRTKGLKKRTLDRYDELLVRINENIGDMPISKIRPVHIAQFYESLSRPGTNHKTGGGLSPKTIREYHNLTSSILGRAVSYRLIDSNPCVIAKDSLPKVIKQEIEIFDSEELKEILAYAENEPIKWKVILHLFIETGMRRGEILGLTEGSLELDTDTPVIHIRQAVYYTPVSGIYVDTPKSSKSVRTLRISSSLATILKEYIAWKRSEEEKYGDKYHRTPYLFTTQLGEHMHPDTITDYLKNFETKYDIPYHINPHKFRHTVASILIHKGVDILTVSKFLGHSSPTVTSNTYAHLINDALAKASNLIVEELLD